VPAAIEQRIAALETAKSAESADRVSKEAVDKIASQVTAAEAKLVKLGQLEEQVSELAGELKKAQAAGQSAPASASSEATGSPVAAELRTRLTKLESALASLSTATASDGKPAGIAPLAQFSARFADLESSVNTQLETLRKDLLSEIDTRNSSTAGSTAKAIASAERLDREVSEIKTDAARLDQRSAVLKAASDKLAATVRAVGEQAANLKVELDSLKGDLQQELAKVARPADVEKTIAPVSEKVAAIEKNLGSVLASETARKKNAERIVLSLELSNLKRVLDRGLPYAAELADVKKVAGGSIDFGALEAHQSNGVPSGPALTAQFRNVAYKIINAEDANANASRLDRLFTAAKSIVQVRRTDIPATEKTAEAAVARIEQLLKQGDMSGALALAEKLPDQSKAPAKDWIGQLAARAGVDRAIAQIENQLKASLGGSVPGGKG
jgi:hypothetical protein